MKVYIVWIKACFGGPINSLRWIDSQWAKEGTAIARRLELTDTFKAFGYSTETLSAFISVGEVADAKLTS